MGAHGERPACRVAATRRTPMTEIPRSGERRARPPSSELPSRQRDEQRLQTRLQQMNVGNNAPCGFCDLDESGKNLAAAIAVRAQDAVLSLHFADSRQR